MRAIDDDKVGYAIPPAESKAGRRVTSGWHIAVWRHRLTYRTVTVGRLLHGGNEIAGECSRWLSPSSSEYQPISFLPAAHWEMRVVFP
ncbi:hypothetical protein ACLB1T_09275 [Escherichia coli]